MIDINKFQPFFENTDLVRLVDELAKRYGKLPSEILCDQSIFEFEFNTAFMLCAISHEIERNKKEPSSSPKDGKKIDLNAMFKMQQKNKPKQGES